jgi:hypothetical protein
MPDHDLRTTIDALCARLQADLQTQAAQMVDRLAEERESTRRETEAKTAELWAAKVDAVRDEWNGRLQAGLADAAADTERRLAAEGERTRLEAEQTRQAAEQARLEIDALTKAASEAADRHRQEIEALREEWQGRLRAGLADATAEADRRLIAETDRIRREVEQAAAEATERVREQTREQTREETREATRQETREEVRREMEQAAALSAAALRTELEQAAAHSTTRLREELEQAATHATARLREDMDQALAAERERAGVELEGERTRVQALLAAERDRSAADLEAERLKTQALSAALEEAQAATAREREAARLATASLQAVQSAQRVHDAQAVLDARVSERQAQLVVVERLLAAVRSIDGARSLSDTLTSLTDAAGTVAPRAALFVVSSGVSRGDETDRHDLQGWHAAGFDAASPVGLRLADADRSARGLLDLALASGSAVSTASEPAPAFARLPADRAGLAVPIIVGGHSVAVLYADDAAAVQPEAPASWPEAIQVLAAHASSCLEQITAVRTTQALQQVSTSAGAGGAKAVTVGSAGQEEESSARRYARLLVSEIKLYNEAAVRTGREKRDLLNRLAPEIDRARRLYEERVSPAVGARAAYFQQELVHTLADGDSALLGGAA